METPFERTNLVRFELSNLCSYAWFHKRCPLHLERTSSPFLTNTKILPTDIVRRTLEEMGEHDYRHLISFGMYNEPMEDPRLFSFIEYARELCPKSFVHVRTNGRSLSSDMIEDLVSVGVDSLQVVLYATRKEWDIKKARIEAAVGKKPFDIELRITDWTCFGDGLGIYDGPERIDNEVCHAPRRQISITRDAEVGLCCWDWKRKHTFGSLHEQTLVDIMRSDKFQETYRRLSAGDRFLDVCKRCRRPIDEEDLNAVL